MKIFDDVVLLELQREEWEEEKKKSSIVIPDSVRAKEEGKDMEALYSHFFKVTDIGPDCKKVKIGDRVFMKPPSIYVPANVQKVVIWIDEQRSERFLVREEGIAGVE